MCARYTLTLDQARLVMAGVVHIFAFVPRYNISPAQRAPVIVKTPKGISCQDLIWGCKYQWSKTLHINARAERIHQTSAFKKILNQRCLVPMDGFYEWKPDKSPVRFTRPKRGLFYVAGLWHANDPGQSENSLSASTGEGNRGGVSNQMSFVLLTTAANASVKPIHDRMPLILREDALEQWLEISDVNFQVSELADKSDLPHYPVSREVNNVRNEHAGLVTQVATERELFKF
jgi:putative SOS response-associated peptidase YedK